MKMSVLATVLVTLAGPALAQAPTSSDPHHPGKAPKAQAQSTAPGKPQAMPGQSGMPMPMGQMMQGRGMPGGSQGMMDQFSTEDMSAFAEAHIASIHAGLRLTADQEKLWPPVETALRNLATLHLSHMQAMRQTGGMTANDPVNMLRTMADHMSQGSDAMRKLADAAAPLHATLDEAQKRRLPVLIRMGSRGMMGQSMMGRGMMGTGGGMMPDGSDGADNDTPNKH